MEPDNPSQPNLRNLQEAIEYRFRDEALLRLALTHPSVSYEAPEETAHNQRLEFLGDAVLELVLSVDLYRKFPAAEEGPLTKARAHLVNRRSLATQARRLALGDYLILSRGEEVSGGRHRLSSLADAFEALLGAMFLDGGYDVAHDFILRCFGTPFGKLADIPNLDNPKGELQEWLQARSTEAPRYEITDLQGPDHDRVFECAVYHLGRELGRGRGKSKKGAESQAALQALQELRRFDSEEDL